jgi:hypothetical protein
VTVLLARNRQPSPTVAAGVPHAELAAELIMISLPSGLLAMVCAATGSEYCFPKKRPFVDDAPGRLGSSFVGASPRIPRASVQAHEARNLTGAQHSLRRLGQQTQIAAGASRWC